MGTERKMNDEHVQNSYEGAKLVLEYIRVFMWPIVLIIALFLFKEDVAKIFREREIEVAGLKIGQRINAVKENLNNIEANAQIELTDIRELVEELKTVAVQSPASIPQASDKVTEKIEALSANLDKKVGQLRQETMTVQEDLPQEQSPSNQKQLAKPLELQGFQELLAKNIDGAIAAFTEAEMFWPDYHNVAEITRLLLSERNKFSASSNTADDIVWKELYTTLLSQYSWGMPEDIRKKFRE